MLFKKVKTKFIFILKNHYAYIIIGIIALIYALFRIKVHTWESYSFATSAQGLFSLVQEHSLHNRHAYLFPDFSHYHPNHPLSHLLVYSFYKISLFFSLPISPLYIAQWTNIIFGILSLAACFKLLRKLNISYATSTLIIAIYGFTDLHWYQSQSGEVYILSFFFLICSFLYFSSYLEKSVSKIRRNLYLLLSAFFYSLSVGFHIIAFFSCFVYLLLFIFNYNNTKDRSSIIDLFKFILISMTIGIVIYILPFVTVLKVDSLKTYYNLITLYSDIFGIGIGMSFRNGHVVSFFIHELLTGITYFMKSILIADFWTSTIRYSLFAIVTILGIISLFKKQILSTLMLLIWTYTYFIVIIFIIGISDVNDYWLFVLFPFIAFLIIQLETFFSSRYLHLIGIVVCFLIFTINFSTDIYPKSSIKTKDYYFSSIVENELVKKMNFVFMLGLGDKVFPELWYLSNIVHNPNVFVQFDQDAYFPLSVGNRFEYDIEILLKNINENFNDFIFIYDADSQGPEQLKNEFIKNGFTGRVILTRTSTIRTKYLRKSCGEYDDNGLTKNLIVSEFSRVRYN